MEKWIEFQGGLGIIRLSLIGGFQIFERGNEYNVIAVGLNHSDTLATMASFKTMDEAKAYLHELINYITITN